jgi:hypothetical protein
LEITLAFAGQDSFPKKTSYLHVANGGWFAVVVQEPCLRKTRLGSAAAELERKRCGKGRTEEARIIPKLNFGRATDARFIHVKLFGNLNLDKEGRSP